MSYEIREGDFEEFFSVPFICYDQTTPYVSPMKSDLKRFLSTTENPLFARHGKGTYYTVRKDGVPIGRIAAHIHDDSNHLHRLNRSYFGFFDCANDIKAARLLLDAAEAWGHSQGCNEIAGNFNLTAMQQLGVVTGGFEYHPYTDQAYNPPHIPRLLEACGYTPFFPVTTFELDLRHFDPETLKGEKELSMIKAKDLDWQRLRVRGFEHLMRDACKLLNDGFAQNPMFVPLTEEEFFFQAKEMIWIIDKRISVLVYKQNSPIGVIVCIPDLNPLVRATAARVGLSILWDYLRYRLNRRRAVLVFASVCKEFQNQGLSGAMLYQATASLKKAGYTHLGFTWVSDQNIGALRQIEKMGARPLHRLHLFRRCLKQAA